MNYKDQITDESVAPISTHHGEFIIGAVEVVRADENDSVACEGKENYV